MRSPTEPSGSRAGEVVFSRAFSENRGLPVKAADGKPPFRELNHTADLRVEILGKDEEELFRNAVHSLYVLLGLSVGPQRVERPPVERLEILGQDPEEALVQLLGELLYRVTVERQQLMPDTLSVIRGEQGEQGCGVTLIGRCLPLTDEMLQGKREIKAVTYHDVQIRESAQGFSARVVFDV